MNRIMPFLSEVYDFFWGDLSKELLHLRLDLAFSVGLFMIGGYIIGGIGAMLMGSLVGIEIGIRIWRRTQRMDCK